MKGVIKFITVVGSIAMAVLCVAMLVIYSLIGPSTIYAVNSVNSDFSGIYTIEYTGDYGLDELLEGDGVTNNSDLISHLIKKLSYGIIDPSEGYNLSTGSTSNDNSVPLYYDDGTYEDNSDINSEDNSIYHNIEGCACAMKNNLGESVVARNLDYVYDEMLFIHTKPTDGYESISATCLDLLGIQTVNSEDNKMLKRFSMLTGIYLPLEGMNEKGLVVTDLTLKKNGFNINQDDIMKPNITPSVAVRLILDKAATVEEALLLLTSYNMHMGGDLGHHHFMISDLERTVVVEYDANNTMLYRDINVISNHNLINNILEDTSSVSHSMYNKLSNIVHHTYMTNEDIMASLRDVRLVIDGEYSSLYSIIYNQSTLGVEFTHRNFSSETHTMKIGTDEKWTIE